MLNFVEGFQDVPVEEWYFSAVTTLHVTQCGSPA
jgi:hypothetical protein